MKKFVLLSLPIIALVTGVSCNGPAAEDRNAMHARAKIIGDSISNSIKSKMAEAEFQGPNIIKVDTVKPSAADTAKKTK